MNLQLQSADLAASRSLVAKILRAFFTLLLCAGIPSLSEAQTLITLVNLSGSNGSNPLFGSLIQGADGNLYGMTSAGGSHRQGTVFQVALQGTITTLYNFCAKSGCADGSAPYGGLILARDGNFYGTTEAGGAHGYGTVFKITSQGKLTTLHSFTLRDGANPYAGLLQAKDGNFYGTTESGGAHLLGTVFKITSLGAFTTMHSFNSSDGSSPEAPLMQASDGNFYSTTYNGGSGGYGTIFKMTTSGALTTLHVFDREIDGSAITSGLVQASDGTFYGSATLGGPSGYGSVYSMTSSGTVTVLHGFAATDGSSPNAMTIGSDGNLYGTTISGGGGNGTIFQLAPQGAFSTLHMFGGTEGADSFAGLVQASNGIFYGTTRVGGTKNDGTVFSIDVGL